MDGSLVLVRFFLCLVVAVPAGVTRGARRTAGTGAVSRPTWPPPPQRSRSPPPCRLPGAVSSTARRLAVCSKDDGGSACGTCGGAPGGPAAVPDGGGGRGDPRGRRVRTHTGGGARTCFLRRRCPRARFGHPPTPPKGSHFPVTHPYRPPHLAAVTLHPAGTPLPPPRVLLAPRRYQRTCRWGGLPAGPPTGAAAAAAAATTPRHPARAGAGVDGRRGEAGSWRPPAGGGGAAAAARRWRRTGRTRGPWRRRARLTERLVFCARPWL